MGTTSTARAPQLDSEALTSRRPVLRVVADATWDDVPEGPVPADVIRYFEEALAREEDRRLLRGTRPRMTAVD